MPVAISASSASISPEGHDWGWGVGTVFRKTKDEWRVNQGILHTLLASTSLYY